jgi:hypothetical protein
MRRWITRLGGALLVLALVLGGAAGLLAWRVRQGPMSLDFLVPRLKAALGQGDEGWQVDVDRLELVWEAAAHQIEIRARGLRLARPNEGAVVTLAAARVRLNRRAIFRGEVVVTGIELDAPEIRLVRDAGGRFAMQLEPSAGSGGDLGWLAPMMRRLDHVAVRDGRIAFVDEASGTSWLVPDVDADAWHAGGPVRAQVGLSIGTGEAAIPLWFDGIYRVEAGTLDLQVSSPGADIGAAFAAWPTTLADQARAWLTTHVQDGRIGRTVLAVSGHTVRDGGWRLALDSLDATVAFEGLAVRYLDTMPPVTGVGGLARFTRDGVAVTVETGKLDALQVGPAIVRVAWPPEARNHLAIDARCRGPLASLVAVLDHEPVSLGRRVTFQTRNIAGTTVSRVRLAFPIEGPPPAFGGLGLHASSTITDASLSVADDFAIERGQARVVVDERAVAIDGTVAFRDVPLEVRLRSHFRRPASRRMEIRGRLEPEALRAFGVEVGSALTGPIDGRVRVAPRRDGRTLADVDVDLAPATLAIPALALAKPPGDPGRLLARLEIADGLVRAVDHFAGTAGTATVRGAAGRADDGGPWNRVDGTIGLAIPNHPDESGAVRVAMRAQDRTWQVALDSPDVGQLLRAYGYDQARGGHMTLEGTADPRSDGVPFDAQVTVEGVTLSRVPWLVKAVSLASIRGLLDVGSEQTVVVDRAVATLASRPPHQLEIRDAVARGPQLGLTLAGTVDREADTLDLHGTMIPSYYLLNQGVGHIPVVGGILERATGGAVQAVAFTVQGPRSDPAVSVQPISSLAPGVLRDWLQKLGL